jgi:hypothetical protein
MTSQADTLKVQVGTVADSESRTALKTISDNGQVMTDRDQLKITFDSGDTAVPTGTA